MAAVAVAGALRQDLPGGGDRRRPDGVEHDSLLPRPRAGQGAGHPPAHPVAPGSAVLQRRRPPQREPVVAGRPRRSRRRRSASSPAHTPVPGTCLAPSSTTRPDGFPRATSPSSPTSTARMTNGRSSPGRSSPATPCSSTWQPSTVRQEWPERDGGACCRCGSSATTWSTRRDPGRPHPRSRPSSVRSRQARRWPTRSFPFSGARPGTEAVPSR